MRTVWLGSVALLLVGCLLIPAGAEAAFGDARRSGMGGVLLPGSGLSSLNPAWRGVSMPRGSRAIPLPLGLAAGLLADTEGMDDFEAAYTRVKAAYPFFEVELAPEEDLSRDIEIEVGQDFFRIDLGEGRLAVPSEAVKTDFATTAGLFALGAGPLHVGVSTILVSDGDVDVGEDFRAALQGGFELEPSTAYGGFADNTAQFAAAVEIGSSFQLGSLDIGGDTPWGLRGGVAVKGLVGLAYLDGRVDAEFTTGDPIFDENDPLDVTYEAELFTNRSLGRGYGFDLGLAAIRGPWLLGLSVENLAAEIHWSVERRTEVLDAQGTVISTTDPTARDVVGKLPQTWVANAAYVGGSWLLAGDLRLEQDELRWHGGAERRFSVLAARGGFSWSADDGVQGAVGAGVGAGGLSVDLSVRTHPRVYSEGRGLFLGASFGLPF